VRRLAVGDREVERLGSPSLGAEEILEEGRRWITLRVVPIEQALAIVHRLETKNGRVTHLGKSGAKGGAKSGAKSGGVREGRVRVWHLRKRGSVTSGKRFRVCKEDPLFLSLTLRTWSNMPIAVREWKSPPSLKASIIDLQLVI